jgi:ABC-type Fe3+/spermidine/putrescine transport system ATPase subunit
LKNGDIVADEAPHDLYYNAKTIDTARFLGHTNLFRGVVDGKSLRLCSYVDFPRPVDCTVVLPQKAATALATNNSSVVACIPRNWIQISQQCSPGGLIFKGLAGTPAFTGSDWEFRIIVAGGVEFDVIMEDEHFAHFAMFIDQKTPLSVMISDVALLSDSNEISASH